MQFLKDKDKIIIIDFGSQVTKLIARRIRDLGVYSEIISPKSLYKIKKFNNIKGIIFSGGPSTVTKKNFHKMIKTINTLTHTKGIYKCLKKFLLKEQQVQNYQLQPQMTKKLSILIFL